MKLPEENIEYTCNWVGKIPSWKHNKYYAWKKINVGQKILNWISIKLKPLLFKSHHWDNEKASYWLGGNICKHVFDKKLSFKINK